MTDKPSKGGQTGAASLVGHGGEPWDLHVQRLSRYFHGIKDSERVGIFFQAMPSLEFIGVLKDNFPWFRMMF